MKKTLIWMLVTAMLASTVLVSCSDAPAAEDAAARIVALIRDEKQFLELSEKVSGFIREKCCIKQTTEKEINLIKKMAEKTGEDQ